MARKKMSLSDMAKGLESALPPRDGESEMDHHKRLMRHMHMELAEYEEAGALKDWAEQEEQEHHMDGTPQHMNADDSSDEEGMAASKDDEDEEAMAARHAEEMANCADGMREETAARHKKEDEEMAARKFARKRDEDEDEEDEEEEEEKASSRKEEAGAKVPYLETSAHKQESATKEKASRMSAPARKPHIDQIASHPMVVKMAQELNNMKLEKIRQDATAAVDRAIREGRLIPSQRSWGIEYCTANPKGFETFLGSQPRIVKAGADGTFTTRLGEPKQDANTVFSTKDLSILANIGLESPEQIEKCAQARNKWDLRFPRPRVMLDDSNVFAQGANGTGDRYEEK